MAEDVSKSENQSRKFLGDEIEEVESVGVYHGVGGFDQETGISDPNYFRNGRGAHSSRSRDHRMKWRDSVSTCPHNPSHPPHFRKYPLFKQHNVLYVAELGGVSSQLAAFCAGPVIMLGLMEVSPDPGGKFHRENSQFIPLLFIAIIRHYRDK